jgi:hypothetical protein
MAAFAAFILSRAFMFVRVGVKSIVLLRAKVYYVLTIHFRSPCGHDNDRLTLGVT